MRDHHDRFATEIGRHGFGGLDRFAGCWVASCGCGWSGGLAASEDAAVADYCLHLSSALPAGARVATAA
jgi:hypothetical protein